MKALVMLAVFLAACVTGGAVRRYGSGAFELQIGPMDGAYVLYGDERFYREDHLQAWGLDRPGRPSGAVRIVGRVARKGLTVQQAFAAIGPDLGALTVTQGHIRELIDSGNLRTTPGRTHDVSETALMLVTPGDETAQADLSNLYVIGVTRSPNGTVVVFPRKFRCTHAEEIDGCEPAADEMLGGRFQMVGRSLNSGVILNHAP